MVCVGTRTQYGTYRVWPRVWRPRSTDPFFKSYRCPTIRLVLKAKVVGALLSYDSRLAPRAGSEAAEGWVALVPFNDQLLEVARALPPHMQRGVRLEELVQRIIADPLRHWEVVRVPGREIAHDERFKLPLLSAAVCSRQVGEAAKPVIRTTCQRRISSDVCRRALLAAFLTPLPGIAGVITPRIARRVPSG